MSWIIGYVGRSLSPSRRETLAALAERPIVERSGRTYYVAAGGLADTCMGGDLPGGQGHWCVVGTGVPIDDGESYLLSPRDWKRKLSSKRPHLERLGGGFVALRWRTRHVEAFSDIMGLRSLYWLRVDNGYVFSTRPNWLASMAGGLPINWEAFGSHWLAYNQLSYRSLIRDVERLGPGGYAVLTDVNARVENTPYSPPPHRSRESPTELLSSLLRVSDERIVSLGLSGGLDSRTLLALRPRGDRFGVHIFGPRSREDVQVALSLSENERLLFSYFHIPPVDGTDLLRVVSDHAVGSQAVSPASAALSLRYYPELRAQRKLVVDGGFGEILRRQFMNRLIRRGRDAVIEKGVQGAFDCVRFARASIFTEPVQRTLERGAQQDMLAFLDEASLWLDLGVRNAIDLMNVRMRLPNFFGYDQARLDELVQNFMPFAHPRFIDAVFRIPAGRRTGGRLSRRIIAAHSPKLRRYPLVKGDVTYPYGLPSFVVNVYVKLKKRFGDTKPPTERTLVLEQLKEFVMDRIRSADVKNDEAYDARKLTELAEGYYRDGTHGAELDWWLAFDLWRVSIERNSG